MKHLTYKLYDIQARMESLKKEDLFFRKEVSPQMQGYLTRFEKRYRNGEIDIFAYENAARRYRETQKNHIDLLQHILSLKSEIEALIGEDNE